MLELGEYATYKEFGLDLINCLEHFGFTESIKEGEKAKSRTLTTPQDITLIFYGYKATNAGTVKRLKRNSYDCLVRFKGEDVSFITICKEIIEKCHIGKFPAELIKNIVYIVLRSISQRPLTTIETTISDYLLIENQLIKINSPLYNNRCLSSEEIHNGIKELRNALSSLDDVGKFSFQEIINIISYIAIIEEFNYPKIEGDTKYRGRSDCFGRYIEVLFGDMDELSRHVSEESFSVGANFIHDQRYQDYYLTEYIEMDRLELSKQGEYF